MVASNDLRWRAVVLYYVYGVDMNVIGAILGVSRRSISRWNQKFKSEGNVSGDEASVHGVNWPEAVLDFVRQYAKQHPCFYLDELQEAMMLEFPHVRNVSTSTICRALRFNLNLTRKVIRFMATVTKLNYPSIRIGFGETCA